MNLGADISTIRCAPIEFSQIYVLYAIKQWKTKEIGFCYRFAVGDGL